MGRIIYRAMSKVAQVKATYDDKINATKQVGMLLLRGRYVVRHHK